MIKRLACNKPATVHRCSAVNAQQNSQNLSNSNSICNLKSGVACEKMEKGSDNQSISGIISIDNIFYPLDVAQRTDGDAQTDWER